MQDIASCYPVAKFAKSTSAKSVILILEETYNAFGNPVQQKSDSGPPFNAREMKTFTDNRNIQQVKTPPEHPSPNNPETVIKPLSKAMKNWLFSKSRRKENFILIFSKLLLHPSFCNGCSPSSYDFSRWLYE